VGRCGTKGYRSVSSTLDTPLLKCFGFNVIFPANFPALRRRICHEEETAFDGADRREERPVEETGGWVLPSCLNFPFRLSTRDEITEQLSTVE
jgi:hypothetical protein